MDDGLDLTKNSDKALYDADRAVIEHLLAAHADPRTKQWQDEFLRRVAAYRNALAGVKRDGRTLRHNSERIPNELATRPLVRTLMQDHRKLLGLLGQESLSTTMLLDVARRYVTCVADVRNTHLDVSLSPFLGSIEISGD